MGGFVLILPVGGDQYGGHHGQAAEGGGDHVAHHIAVVVLAGPDKAALAADDPGHRIVDEGVKIGDAKRFEPGLVLLLKYLLEDILEGMVVLFGDGVLRGEPQVLPGVDGILETGARKRDDGAVLVVLPLEHAGTLKLIDRLAEVPAVGPGKDQLGHAGARHPVFGGFIHIAVGMTGNGDRLLPGLHHRGNAPDHDGRAEDRTIQNGADGPVGGLPHLGKLVLLHPLLVGGNGGAFDRHAVLLGGLGRLHRHPVGRLLPLGQAQIKVDRLQFHVGQQQFFFDLLPQDPGHLVPVHLHQRGGHLNFFHGLLLGFPIDFDGTNYTASQPKTQDFRRIASFLVVLPVVLAALSRYTVLCLSEAAGNA